MTLYGLSDGRLLALHTFTAKPNPTLFVSRNVPEHQIAAWQGAALCGYFPGDSGRIDKVLENARTKIRPHRERVGEVQCIVVDAELAGSRHTVWFALDRGACIMRMIRVQEGKAIPPSTQPAASRTVTEPNPPVRVTLTLDDVQVERFGDHWIPLSGTLTEEVIYARGPSSVLVRKLQRTRLELNPDTRDVSFTPNIPEGTRVRFVGEPNPITHEWRAGKIIPREDKEMTARLRAIVGDRRFTTDAGELSILALARGPAMFLALVGGIFALQWLWLWARARRNRHPIRQ